MTAKDWLETMVSPELANAILVQRKLLKKPMGELAGKGFARELQLIPEHQREEAVELWALNGWQGFKAEWIMRAISQSTSRRGIVGAAINMVTNDGQRDNRGFGRFVQQLPAIAKH